MDILLKGITFKILHLKIDKLFFKEVMPVYTPTQYRMKVSVFLHLHQHILLNFQIFQPDRWKWNLILFYIYISLIVREYIFIFVYEFLCELPLFSIWLCLFSD